LIGVNLFLKHLFILQLNLDANDKNYVIDELHLRLPNDIIEIEYMILDEYESE